MDGDGVKMMDKIRSFFGQTLFSDFASEGPSVKERAYDRLVKGLVEAFEGFPGGPVTADSGVATLLWMAKVVCSEAIRGAELRHRLRDVLVYRGVGPHESDALLLKRVSELDDALRSTAEIAAILSVPSEENATLFRRRLIQRVRDVLEGERRGNELRNCIWMNWMRTDTEVIRAINQRESLIGAMATMGGDGVKMMGKIRSFFEQTLFPDFASEESDKERAYDRLSKGIVEAIRMVGRDGFGHREVTADSGDATLLWEVERVCSEANSGSELRRRLHETLKKPHELMTDSLLVERVRQLSLGQFKQVVASEPLPDCFGG